MSTMNVKITLEWSLAAASFLGGIVISFIGAGYGLTNVSGVGAGFVPLAAGLLMALAGALWMLQLARARNAPTPNSSGDGSALVALLDDEEDEMSDDAFPDRAGWIRVTVIIGSILAAALLLPIVGYTIAMSLQLTAVLFLVSKRKLWLAASVSIGAALASRLVFEVWLGTALPGSSVAFLALMGL